MEVQYTILSSEGQEVINEDSSKALKNIQKIADEQDKWLYLDGNSTNTEKLEVSHLEDASNIILNDALIGG